MSRTCRTFATWILLGCCLCAESAAAASTPNKDQSRSITDRTVTWPSADQWKRVLLLRDYNSRVVVLSTTLLGCAAGMVGSFTLLRKRALMGDALSHATLPGIATAFIVAASLGADGKSLPILLFGATIAGLIGVASILLIRSTTRLKEDTALGIVLSVFFGAGISLLTIAQKMESGHAAGLESFIYGKTASMGANDARLIATSALACVIATLFLFKELKLLCFDEGFAHSRGFPVLLLDWVLMSLVVIISIVGLQAVGLVLMIALLVIPAAAARFWTETMWRMTFVSAGLGAAGGMLGAAISALFSKLPSGAMIVLVCTFFFLISMFFGRRRGVLVRWYRRIQLNRSIERQHLLRGMYEILEETLTVNSPDGKSGLNASDQSFPLGLTVPVSEVLKKRSWTMPRLLQAIIKAEQDGLVKYRGTRVGFTPAGGDAAARLTHQHRLWELYLITYADVAPGRVDRDADAIEHVLEPEIVARLETLLQQRRHNIGIPKSPHELQPSPSGGPSK